MDDEDWGKSTILNEDRINDHTSNNKINDPVFFKLSVTHEVYSMKTMILNQLEINEFSLQQLEEDNVSKSKNLNLNSEFQTLRHVFESRIYNMISN